MRLHTVVSSLCFGTALGFAKDGYKIARGGWNGKGMFVQLQVPDENSKMQRPYLYMSPVDGALVPWVASQSDLLADDWDVLEEAKDKCVNEEAEQQQAEYATPCTAGVGYDPHWQEVNARMECLRAAAAVCSTSKLPNNDTVKLAREFYSFVNGQ